MQSKISTAFFYYKGHQKKNKIGQQLLCYRFCNNFVMGILLSQKQKNHKTI